MSENELKLINIIREHDTPTRAIEIAIGIMLEFLAQGESSQEQPPAYQQESV